MSEDYKKAIKEVWSHFNKIEIYKNIKDQSDYFLLLETIELMFNNQDEVKQNLSKQLFVIQNNAYSILNNKNINN